MEHRQTPNEAVEILMKQSGELLDTRVELTKLKMLRSATGIVSEAVAKSTVFIFLLVGYIALNISLALLLGEWLGKAYLGFLIMAAINLIVGLVILKSGGAGMKTTIQNWLISAVFKKKTA